MEGEIDVIRLCLFVFACFLKRGIEEEEEKVFDWGKWGNGDWKDWAELGENFDLIWRGWQGTSDLIWFSYLMLLQSF